MPQTARNGKPLTTLPDGRCNTSRRMAGGGAVDQPTRVINVREYREQTAHVIMLRPWTTDPGVLREMVARGIEDRRKAKRPTNDRRKAES